MREVKNAITEAGIKEWQVVVFFLGDQSFAINVDKTLSIMKWREYSDVPNAPKAMIGITSIRGEVLPILDLRVFLNIKSKSEIEQCKIIVAEFSDTKLCFVVDAVDRIVSVNPDDVDTSFAGSFFGEWILYVIKQDKRNLFLLDYESIVQNINPQLSLGKKLDPAVLQEYTEDIADPSEYRIIIAEDSPLIGSQIKGSLEAGGFTNLLICSNGKEAYEHITKTDAHFDLLITDVEMPHLDGLTLTRQLKENKTTQSLPIIVFSSTLTQDIKSKATIAGSSYQVSKSEMSKLVEYTAKIIREKQQKGGNAVK